MKELAEEEAKHLQKLKKSGMKRLSWRQDEVPNPMISEYLAVDGTVENAGL